MLTMYFNVIYHLDDDIYVIDGYVDSDTGRFFSQKELIALRDTRAYVDRLDIAYIYILKELFSAGYADDAKAKGHAFESVSISGVISSIEIKDTGTLIASWSAKFGSSAPQSAAEARELIAYAEARGRDKKSLGTDAYQEFLNTIYKRKESPYAAWSLIREIFPRLHVDLSGAKKLVAGYQYAAPGWYSNVYYYDLSKAYPASALSDIPCKTPTIYNFYKSPMSNKFYIYDIEFVSKKHIKGIDFLPKETCILQIPVKLFELACENYKFFKLKVRRTLEFKTRKSIFTNFYSKNLLNTSKSPFISSYNKRIANSLVGYLGRNEKFKRTKFVYIDEKIKTATYDAHVEELYIPAYIAILDRHKARFLRDLERFGDVIYANTDGFLTTTPHDLDCMNMFMPVSSKFGVWCEKDVLETLYIHGINTYAGISAVTGDTVNIASGIAEHAAISPAALARHDYEWSVNIPSADGKLYRRTYRSHIQS